MRVQLSEKSKAEFIELIAKDSITCWFEGDEFVMPSGQGKTAKGIVLGKLLVWRHRQTEVDELQVKLNGAEERALTCLEYKDKYRAERDELQKRVDAVKTLIEEYRDPPTEDKTFQHALSIVADELEQALKGGDQ
ncbi:hypothetical protein [Acinetobacter junii]|nr:hypothetical protein [Acinetobacter junii]